MVPACDLPHGKQSKPLLHSRFKTSWGYRETLSKNQNITTFFFTIRSDERFYTTLFKTQVSILAKQRIRHSGVAGTLPPKDPEATVPLEASFYKCFASGLGEAKAIAVLRLLALGAWWG